MAGTSPAMTMSLRASLLRQLYARTAASPGPGTVAKPALLA
jgi:hypothetical protein